MGSVATRVGLPYRARLKEGFMGLGVLGLGSKLLKGRYIGDYIGNYFGGY